MAKNRIWLSLSLAAGTTILLLAALPINVKDDPLVRMPGTQPAPEGSVSLEAPNRCLNCHADYNSAVEPGLNWRGSMMAHSARDFLFYACMTVAGQDSVWAIGRPNATDLCLRCHFPKGWAEGRSDPANGSSMTGADFDGVQCDFCHRAYDPFFEATFAGTREGSDYEGYWDETNNSDTPSQAAAAETRLEDAGQAQNVLLLNGDPFFISNLPPQEFLENASGQYFLSSAADKRASFADASARHRMLYSRYHKSKYFCAACHDVSNPILANLLLGGVGVDESRADFPSGRTLWTEENPAYSYFHVERTFSEFMLSDYGQPGGAPGLGPFAPEQFNTSSASNWIAKCQDCHMRDVQGLACNKQGVPNRTGDPSTTESVEHPLSGQPLHDLTGGNIWVSWVLASVVSGSPNYDSFNDQQLNQGPSALTLDLSQGLGIDPEALLAGVDRAKQQLHLAASIENLSYDPASGQLAFRVQNRAGHKLISGFPEGRRMFVNVRAYSGGSLVYEINPYDASAGTLKGLDYSYQPDPAGTLPFPADLAAGEHYLDELVYEMHPSSVELTGESETFHFALATGRYKDNRIPPKGFRIAKAGERLSAPAWEGAEASGYYSAAEYSGGYDDVSLTILPGAETVEVSLYYQTTSREYVEFLRDEINGNPDNCTLPSTPGLEGCDPSNYIIGSDPFFAQLRAWGDTIWRLWSHNMNVDGASPFLMAQAALGGNVPPHPQPIGPGTPPAPPQPIGPGTPPAPPQPVGQ